MQQKYTKITEQLTQQIRDASKKIAEQQQLKLVLTREGVGYGGIDITPDVEKTLNITEKATPTPRTARREPRGSPFLHPRSFVTQFVLDGCEKPARKHLL